MNQSNQSTDMDIKRKLKEERKKHKNGLSTRWDKEKAKKP